MSYKYVLSLLTILIDTGLFQGMLNKVSQYLEVVLTGDQMLFAKKASKFRTHPPLQIQSTMPTRKQKSRHQIGKWSILKSLEQVLFMGEVRSEEANSIFGTAKPCA